MNCKRVASIRNILQQEGLDALFVFGLPNIRYLCGFTGTDGVLFISRADVVFLTDSRYVEQAETQVESGRIVRYANKLQALDSLADELSAKRVGFDAESVNVSQYQDLQQLTKVTSWVPLTEQLKALRCLKSEEELTQLRKAAALNHRAFDEILVEIRAGVRECDISLALEFALKRMGGEKNAFDFIVASGVRGALPHGVASEKRLEKGELVTIDFGTCVNGYHSDETVTFAIGNVDRKLRQIFDIVLEAHDSAIAAVKPGMAIAALDAVAREHIAQNGFGDYFGHGLGHGVGLEIHEYPGVSPRSEGVLEEGMVITVEPGIYVPDVGGVRIEDTIVVTEGGCETLTSISKHFRQL